MCGHPPRQTQTVETYLVGQVTIVEGMRKTLNEGILMFLSSQDVHRIEIVVIVATADGHHARHRLVQIAVQLTVITEIALGGRNEVMPHQPVDKCRRHLGVIIATLRTAAIASATVSEITSSNAKKDCANNRLLVKKNQRI